MKRAGLLGTSLFGAFALIINLLSPTFANAATYSFSIPGGSAAYGSLPWGQTFTIPAGKSGTISSISNIYLMSYCNTIADVTQVRIYSSPSKTTLLATATNTFTSPMASGCTFASAQNFTANFTPFSVTENLQYYFELTRISGNSGNFYFYENGSNPYSGGAAYHGGTINTSYDLGMTINIDFQPGPVTASIALTSGSTTATFRAVSQLKATLNTSGSVTFYANGKLIPGCRKVLTSANIAYCNWKPSIHGNVQIAIVANPTDSANYSQGSASASTIGVIARSNTR